MTPFTKIPNGILEKLILLNFTKSEILIFLIIARFDLGFRGLREFHAKQEDFTRIFGISKSSASNATRSLIKRRVILRPEKNIFKINENTDEWSSENTRYISSPDYKALITKHITLQKVKND